MIIKRYIVKNMNEAMTRIRYELGKDAVIISQRKIRKPGFLGFFSKKIMEVTVAVENSKKNDDYNMKESIEAIKKVVEKKNVEVNSDTVETHKEVEVAKKSDALEEKRNSELLDEIKQMKDMINNIASKSPEKATRKSKTQQMLEKADLSDTNVKKILTKVKNTDMEIEEIEKVRMAIEKMTSVSRAKMEGIVILVGPTGVGKTTTIAKLAGRLALTENKKVGLITIDTYRIGAVEQLRTYAEIMNLPFKVVLTTKEMDAAIESMQDCDVILIDTTGRSSKNVMQISELRAFVEKASTENIHLVLSCTTKNRDIEAIINGYRALNFKNVIITKLDETATYGSILNILEMAKEPISFVCTGQNVPDDIKTITSKEVANLILGEDCVC